MDPLILLLAAAGLLMILGAGAALVFGGRSDVDERMERYVGGSTTAVVPDEQPVAQRPAVGERLDRALVNREFASGIKSKIVKSDVKLRVSEYIALRLLFAALGLVLGWYFLRDFSLNLLGLQIPLLALVTGFFGSLIPVIYLKSAARRRLRAFEAQLAQTIELWVNALRSGYSVLQALEAIDQRDRIDGTDRLAHLRQIQLRASIQFEPVEQRRPGLRKIQSVNVHSTNRVKPGVK